MIIPTPEDHGGFPPLEESPWIDIEQRMRRKTIIDPKTGCWLFTGSTGHNGHSQIWDGEKLQYVHRLAAAIYLSYDLLDKEHQINHKDNCPYSNCWFHEHLYVGTAKENTLDSVNVGTHANTAKTHCKGGHPLDEINSYITKEGKRQCKTCQLERVREWRRKKYGN